MIGGFGDGPHLAHLLHGLSLLLEYYRAVGSVDGR
jgi:hypothetical protein